MIGYMTLYLKIQNEEMVAYAKASFDFSVCPTEDMFENLKQSLGDYYKELTGCEKTEVHFCTKEEYELNEKDEIVKYEWGEEENE